MQASFDGEGGCGDGWKAAVDVDLARGMKGMLASSVGGERTGAEAESNGCLDGGALVAGKRAISVLALADVSSSSSATGCNIARGVDERVPHSSG